ncbi:Oca5p KNAG_0J02860 [Huiozyma naganishii CBS 8797]|uniref:Rab-GAP TBC domain-containing protein n=1 Tax=Huiozyma naganishii (strain ATCC MYA-139 / BCRC 22969 / CBS 8797 / KCTC 17520 / NBRC 10181 / NCYC 3082 / Yp74L-3) TaxID=1071383 RepID=J7RBT6_HUIN7|nr:hypothetical protein KNAG_0J02860 [Kazachstania naganishii CBS 8797]CCK72365.1 hypothetical protein KNAG_0J02860 [Kazachstania naganishii CBS 8797]
MSAKPSTPDNKTAISVSHHLKNLKQQFKDRQLINLLIDLVRANDHDSLAYIARTSGIPPQLRHVVWPVLLKYHPMCISPNIMSNTINWDPQTRSYHFNESNTANNSNSNGMSPVQSTTVLHTIKSDSKAPTSEQDKINSGADDAYLDRIISHDLRRYFHSRSSNHTPPTSADSTAPAVEQEIVSILKFAIFNFVNKWSKIFKYESGLAWIALGLAEWFPPSSCVAEPVVLTGRRHSKDAPKEKNSPDLNINNLYQEYPLPSLLRSKLPKEYAFQFADLYERLLLVILHCPDTVRARDQINREFPSKSEHMTNYFPILSGGDLQFQSTIFFKAFASILPELYQPLMEESNLQTNTSRLTWLYWWLKFSGARALQRQDRGRLWDILLGWRPKPNMNSINFFLNYNSKLFDHLYHEVPPGFRSPTNTKNSEYLKSLNKLDPFWFPDLDLFTLGDRDFPFDYNVLREILTKNKYDQQCSDTVDNKRGSEVETKESPLTYSTIDPHIQLVFIYVAILQYNEFKLLEFEETEISEFLNNVPMLSKTDDKNYKKLYVEIDYNAVNKKHNASNFRSHKAYSISETSSTSSLSSGSSANNAAANPNEPASKRHMLIELGNDAKASHSFNDLLNSAGDIWRKWLWKELEENVNSE